MRSPTFLIISLVSTSIFSGSVASSAVAGSSVPSTPHIPEALNRDLNRAIDVMARVRNVLREVQAGIGPEKEARIREDIKRVARECGDVASAIKADVEQPDAPAASSSSSSAPAAASSSSAAPAVTVTAAPAPVTAAPAPAKVAASAAVPPAPVAAAPVIAPVRMTTTAPSSSAIAMTSPRVVAPTTSSPATSVSSGSSSSSSSSSDSIPRTAGKKHARDLSAEQAGKSVRTETLISPSRTEVIELIDSPPSAPRATGFSPASAISATDFIKNVSTSDELPTVSTLSERMAARRNSYTQPSPDLSVLEVKAAPVVAPVITPAVAPVITPSVAPVITPSVAPVITPAAPVQQKSPVSDGPVFISQTTSAATGFIDQDPIDKLVGIINSHKIFTSEIHRIKRMENGPEILKNSVNKDGKKLFQVVVEHAMATKFNDHVSALCNHQLFCEYFADGVEILHRVVESKNEKLAKILLRFEIFKNQASYDLAFLASEFSPELEAEITKCRDARGDL